MSVAVKGKMPLAQACALARELTNHLAPACERIAVAGSIRRGIQMVGDIDLVCVARIETTTVTDIFGERPGPDVDQLDEAMNALWQGGLIEQRLTKAGTVSQWGPRAKRAVFKGLSVDVNAVEASTFGAWMVIKTGPAGFSQALVVPKDRRFVVHANNSHTERRQGLQPTDLRFRDGFQLWRGDERIETPDERDLFAAYGMAWREPRERR